METRAYTRAIHTCDTLARTREYGAAHRSRGRPKEFNGGVTLPRVRDILALFQTASRITDVGGLQRVSPYFVYNR